MLETLKPWLFGVGGLALFVFGMRVEAWREGYGASKAVTKQERAVGHDNSITYTHTLAAVTRGQAIAAAGRALEDSIQRFHPIPTLPGGDHDAAPAAASRAPVCADPFSDPGFRLLYDAGSRAARPASQAGGMLPPPA